VNEDPQAYYDDSDPRVKDTLEKQSMFNSPVYNTVKDTSSLHLNASMSRESGLPLNTRAGSSFIAHHKHSPLDVYNQEQIQVDFDGQYSADIDVDPRLDIACVKVEADDSESASTQYENTNTTIPFDMNSGSELSMQTISISSRETMDQKDFNQSSQDTHENMYIDPSLLPGYRVDEQHTSSMSDKQAASGFSGGPQRQCHVCGKEFTSGSSLTRHMRVHTGERPYRCNVCGKTCRQEAHLHSHMRVHTGEKPYRCEVCDKAFTHKHHLKDHLLTHHGDINRI
jgi:hypothetical protein